ncbi:hypothetical protein ABK905_15420 [Acerihabitans sp. KWT182]|uniref:Uncharacterized protein n=1 Tax=Acerihabitans sp. KWT182 TaxID=3157919 RepID=A0AAU7Q4Z0_9GAMM
MWLIRGLAPWRRGKKGFSWLEIDEAFCNGSPLSVLTKSYDITISPRFNANRQLTVFHIKHGERAVAAINDRLMQDMAE